VDDVARKERWQFYGEYAGVTAMNIGWLAISTQEFKNVPTDGTAQL
jgi:hypothetical protein